MSSSSNLGKNPYESQKNVPKIRKDDATYEWQEGVNDAFEDVMSSRGEGLPDMSVLLKEAEEIERNILSGKPGNKPKETSNDDDLATLMETQEDENLTPTLSKKLSLTDSPEFINRSVDKYQESFASQQETAELREEISSLATRLHNLETTIENLLVERKELPNHLDRLSASINQQFTVMNAKLNSAIESGVMTEQNGQESTQAAEAIGESSRVLEVLSDDLKAQPSKSSQVSMTKPITGKKKKVRLIE